jgi:hypothetical protein
MNEHRRWGRGCRTGQATLELVRETGQFLNGRSIEERLTEQRAHVFAQLDRPDDCARSLELAFKFAERSVDSEKDSGGGFLDEPGADELTEGIGGAAEHGVVLASRAGKWMVSRAARR